MLPHITDYHMLKSINTKPDTFKGLTDHGNMNHNTDIICELSENDIRVPVT